MLGRVWRVSPFAKFTALRARYLTARSKVDAIEMAHAVKYGPGWTLAWLKRGDAAKLEDARCAVDKTTAAFHAHLAAISPRDLSYGIPSHWLCEKLTFEDATRPVGEPLSATPPLSWGATEART